MARRVRRFALVVVVLLLVGSVAVVLTSRPKLDHDRDQVDRRWAPLRVPLADRYEKLTTATAATKTAGGDRAVLRDLDDALRRWAALRRATDQHAKTADEVAAANRLEGLAARLQVNVAGSDRLRASAPVHDALGAFVASVPPSAAVDAYNTAARRYQTTRDGVLRRYAALLLGFDARPTLELAGSS